MTEEFQMEETDNLLAGEWRRCRMMKFKMVREDNVNGQARLVVILSPPEEKRRFLCWPPERYKVPATKEETPQAILV